MREVKKPPTPKKEITKYLDQPLGHTINALWFKGRLNTTGEKFIELILKLVADHGPAVSTAHNAIVASRAGKDVMSSLASGMLTIGPRHGGAIDGAARWLLDGISREISARQVVDEHKAHKKYIMGIGHRIKSAQKPDLRVTALKKFAKKLELTKHLDFALAVEKETLRKKNNLILNVDGAVGAIFLDVLENSGFTPAEIKEEINAGAANSLFVLGRSIGMIGHILDQKRLREPMYRHDTEDILYLD